MPDAHQNLLTPGIIDAYSLAALFESTLNPETRCAGGMSYTSVENTHKVIDPLFLDNLTRRVNEFLGNIDVRVEHVETFSSKTSSRSTRINLSRNDRAALLALQDEIASLTFLDPACGSGNFLTETYICLRRLENRIIAALQQEQAELDLGISIKVSIAQFFGIEINDFAVAVAKTALWIAESQMKQDTAEILHREPDYLPITDYANIVEGNALRMDWARTDYIIGNPPFRGASNMSDEQKADAVSVFGKGRLVNSLDLVGAWFHKAAQCGPGPRCAFVATNSIAQGEQVAPLWKPLAEKYGVEIDFAHRTFRWDNEAFDKAHVHCVIIGFHCNQELLSLRGDSESRSLGEDSKKSPILLNSKTPSSESNETLRSLRSLRQKIEQTAQAILDARARYPKASLADLYDPLTMPADLRAAHEANDKAVLAAYGLAPDTPEPEIVAHLFKLYAEKVNEA